MILIPEKITAGFNERDDCFSKKLAFLVYENERKILSQPRAWDKWRDKKIKPLEFENKPMKGFCLDKAIGGYRTRFNYRGEAVRIYDPRGFEIEITVSNLLNIFKMCSCEVGGELNGEFVYAWEGFQLILMPIVSEDYEELKTYTSLKLENKIFKVKDLVANKIYRDKKNNLKLFLCERLVVNTKYGISKAQIFYDKKHNEIEILDLKNLISEERQATNAEIKIATTALLQSKYKEDIDKKSKRTELVKLNWYSGEETTIQIYSESARRFVTCWIDFRKNEIIDYNNLNYTIKELIAKAKPEVVLFFYKSGELYFDGDQERIYRKQAIEEWCKQNAK